MQKQRLLRSTAKFPTEADKKAKEIEKLNQVDSLKKELTQSKEDNYLLKRKIEYLVKKNEFELQHNKSFNSSKELFHKHQNDSNTNIYS